MKKASLFLSVAWLAMTIVPMEGFSAAESAPAKTGWMARAKAGASAFKTKAGGLFKRKSAQQPPVYTSGSNNGSVTNGTAISMAAASGAESRSASDSNLLNVPQEERIPDPTSTDKAEVEAVINMLQTNLPRSNKLSKFVKVSYTSIPDYLKALVAGKEFPASKSRARVCTVNCGDTKKAESGSVHEVFCLHACIRGTLVPQRALNNMNTNYGEAAKAQTIKSYWEKLEGQSIGGSNVVAQTEAEARTSLMLLENAAKKPQAAVKDTVQIGARKALVNAIADLTIAYADFKKEMGVMDKKAAILRQKAEAVSTNHEAATLHGVSDIEAVFTEGKKKAQSVVSKLKNPLLAQSLNAVTLLDHQMIQNINEEIQKYEEANKQVANAIEGIEKKKTVVVHQDNV